MEQPVPVERLLSLGVEDIKTVAEATAASVGVRRSVYGRRHHRAHLPPPLASFPQSKVETYRVIGTPRRYHKRLNLTGDPAAWDAWEVRGAAARHAPLHLTPRAPRPRRPTCACSTTRSAGTTRAWWPCATLPWSLSGASVRGSPSLHASASLPRHGGASPLTLALALFSQTFRP